MWMFPWKKKQLSVVFLKIWQNSLENIFVRASFFNKTVRRSVTGAASWIQRNLLENLFYKTPPVAASYVSKKQFLIL